MVRTNISTSFIDYLSGVENTADDCP